MLPNFSDLEQDQEASNMAACRAAFMIDFPKEPVICADECDSGSWGCTTCPWRGTATLHPNNMPGG